MIEVRGDNDDLAVLISGEEVEILDANEDQISVDASERCLRQREEDLRGCKYGADEMDFSNRFDVGCGFTIGLHEECCRQRRATTCGIGALRSVRDGVLREERSAVRLWWI